MRKLLTFILILTTTFCYSQGVLPNGAPNYINRTLGGLQADSALILPKRDTTFWMNTKGDLLIRPADSGLYYKKGNSYVKVAPQSQLIQIDSATLFTGTLAQARALQTNKYKTLTITDYGGGVFYKNDTVTVDNTGTQIITSGGQGYSRILDGYVMPEWFGAVKGGVDCSSAFNTTLLSALNLGISEVRLSAGDYYFGSSVTGQSDIKIVGVPNKTRFIAMANSDTANAFNFQILNFQAKSRWSISGVVFDANRTNQNRSYFGDLTTLYGLSIRGTCADIVVDNCVFNDFYSSIFMPSDGAFRNRIRITNNTSNGGWDGISAVSCVESYIDNNTIRGAAFRSIYPFNCRETSVKSNKIINNYYSGAKSVWTASTAKSLGAIIYPTTPVGSFYRCTTAGTTGTTEPPNWLLTTVTDGTVVWTRVNMAATSVALYPKSAKNCDISNNVIKYTYSHAILLDSRADFNLIDNNNIAYAGFTSPSTGNDYINGSKAANAVGIFIGSAPCIRNSISSNVIYQPSGYGVSIVNTCDYNNVNNNIISRCQDPSIAIIGSNGTVSGNTIDSSAGHAIVIGPDDDGGNFITENVAVTGNSGRDNNQSLVHVNGARYIAITGNTSVNAGMFAGGTTGQKSAILVTNKSSLNPQYITITGNTLVNSATFGIYCQNEDYVKFIGNTITGGTGVIQESGANNIIVGY